MKYKLPPCLMISIALKSSLSESSLSKYPSAPLEKERHRYSWSLCILRINILMPGLVILIRRVASIPERLGMDMSRMIESGSNLLSFRRFKSSRPSPASSITSCLYLLEEFSLNPLESIDDHQNRQGPISVALIDTSKEKIKINSRVTLVIGNLHQEHIVVEE